MTNAPTRAPVEIVHVTLTGTLSLELHLIEYTGVSKSVVFRSTVLGASAALWNREK